jgi:hypothetical protein
LRNERLQGKAREAGFVQRESKLTADIFLEMMLYCNSQDGRIPKTTAWRDVMLTVYAHRIVVEPFPSIHRW